MSSMPAVTVAPETLTVTWMVAGSIVVELLVLIVFLVRAAWWLSGRFTNIDASFAATAKEVAQLKFDWAPTSLAAAPSPRPAKTSPA